jgi:hypothetical protein
MKKPKYISIRNFQLKASVYLNDLPIILTRYKKPIAIIDAYTVIGIRKLKAKEVRKDG